MGWILLLLLVVAGPGPGAAAKSAAGWPVLLRGFHRLLQQNTTDPPPPAPGCSATSLPGCATCDGDPDFPESWRCTACAGSLLLLRSTNACGCPAGSFNSAPDTCRDCPKGSFCAGGAYTGEDNAPPATPCSVFGSGLTTIGVRTTRKEGCVNLPGYAFTTVGPDSNPAAVPCPADTYQVGLRKQRGCVPCPPSFTTFNRTMQTNLGACDIDACIESPCGKNMDCIDLPKPAAAGPEGRECRCVPGATFVSELLGCFDPAETSMIGGPTDLGPARALASFEMRCPRGSFVVAVSGAADTQLQSIGPLTCSDGTSTGALPVGFGWQSSFDGKFTTNIAPDGFTGVTITAEYSVKSVSFYRQDQIFSATYGTMADVTTQFGRRQFLNCPNYGVVMGLVGVRAVQSGAPIMLGLICSNLPCPVRTDTMFGPPGAPQMAQAPGSYLANSPDPVPTATATQCCSACTNDFRCQYWVRDDKSGDCFRIYREPFQPGSLLPNDWTYQTAPGFSSGPTTPKNSGISVSGTYVGCFQDTGCAPSSRLKAALALNQPRMTVKQCLDLALLAGWPYAGLAPGTLLGSTSCFGGDRLPTAAANPGCFATCSGNFTERCGDSNCQISVYSVLKPRWPLQLINAGDPTRVSGWYDVECQGAINDYCRWTSTGGGESYWSCALAGREVPNTAPLQIPEQYAITTACQEVGYKGQALSNLNCGDVSLPWENGCQTRQCCKAKCDNEPRCSGFVFGNSEGNNCRSNGDGQNCCWLKGGDCRAIASPLTAAYVRAEAARCEGYPPDPEYGIMFCPDDHKLGTWPQGTVCRSECKYGIQSSDTKPFAVCQSNGQWSDIVGLCKAPCDLPPLLCPESWSGPGNITAAGNRTAAAHDLNGNGTEYAQYGTNDTLGS